MFYCYNKYSHKGYLDCKNKKKLDMNYLNALRSSHLEAYRRGRALGNAMRRKNRGKIPNWTVDNKIPNHLMSEYHKMMVEMNKAT